MAGAVVHEHGPLTGDVPPSGEAQGIAAPWQAVHPEVQIAGFLPGKGLPGGIPVGDRGGIAGKGGSPGVRQAGGAQVVLPLPQLRQNLPAAEFRQRLVIIQAYGGGDTAGNGSIRAPGGRRHRGQQGKEHDCGQQGRAQPEGCSSFFHR